MNELFVIDGHNENPSIYSNHGVTRVVTDWIFLTILFKVWFLNGAYEKIYVGKYRLLKQISIIPVN